MKTKLTLTIDQGISHRAKSLARQRRSSLSQLVEDLLANQVGAAATSQGKSFTRRWAGRMALSEKDDARTRKLKKKYNINERK